MQGKPCAHPVQLDALDAVAVFLLEDAMVGLIVRTHVRPHQVLELVPATTGRCSDGASAQPPGDLTALQASKSTKGRHLQ